MNISTTRQQNSTALYNGFIDGIPIGLGYFAVSFSLGIAAKQSGLNPLQGFIASILNSASAGEYAGFSLIKTHSTFFEIALITLIANARYMLMSFSLSQKMHPKTHFYHRLLLSFYITDEFFGITIAKPGYINPFYTYGAILFAIPCWSIGTAIGIIAGSLLPLRIVSALSVALYGMFLAIIIPAAKRDKTIGILIIISFLSSLFINYIPIVSTLSSGTKTIILTVTISALAAILFPKKVTNKVEDTEYDR